MFGFWEHYQKHTWWYTFNTHLHACKHTHTHTHQIAIAEIACSLPDFSTLCTALKLTGLDATLEDGLWTVFAPTEDAFNALPPDVLAGLLDDVDALTDVLLFHAVPGQAITSRDLLCGIVPDDNLITMANGKDSRTVCKEGVPTYQKGAGNGEDNLPAIIGPDNFACNGVIHIVDNVLLSQTVGGGPPATTPPVECSSIGKRDCLETLCCIFLFDSFAFYHLLKWPKLEILYPGYNYLPTNVQLDTLPFSSLSHVRLQPKLLVLHLIFQHCVMRWGLLV